MRRSRINQLIAEAKSFFARMHFALPPWAFWGPDEWKGLGQSEVVRAQLGWDLTDYGEGDFEKTGLILFTLRNGNPKQNLAKPYAEKIMIVSENQVCPMHFHWTKMEDIINRGGGNLVIELHGSTRDEAFSPDPVTVMIDGMECTVPAGGLVTLHPGESISLTRGMYHAFWGEEGKGMVLVGEVSSVNDDNTDNRFYTELRRFPAIDEDEPPLHLLVTDYEKYV